MRPSERLQRLRAHYDARRFRDRLFPQGIFADPAWDILVDLAMARELDKVVSVSSACIASAAPPTTGLRHICILEAAKLIERRRDPWDQRRSHLSLTPAAVAAFNRWTASPSIEPCGAESLDAEVLLLRAKLEHIRELAA